MPTQEIIQKSKIYFNLNPGDRLYDYHNSVNEASQQLCLENPVLLSDRKDLFARSRKLVHEKGYVYKKKKSRTYDEKANEDRDDTVSKKARLSGDLRSKKIKELNEDLSEIDIEVRLVNQQREKYKNVNDLTRAIASTERLGDLRVKKRKLQDELTVLQMKEAKVKKTIKSMENKNKFICNQSEYKGSIETFFKKSNDQEKAVSTENDMMEKEAISGNSGEADDKVKTNVSPESSDDIDTCMNSSGMDVDDKADDRTIKSTKDFL